MLQQGADWHQERGCKVTSVEVKSFWKATGSGPAKQARVSHLHQPANEVRLPPTSLGASKQCIFPGYGLRADSTMLALHHEHQNVFGTGRWWFLLRSPQSSWLLNDRQDWGASIAFVKHRLMNPPRLSTCLTEPQPSNHLEVGAVRHVAAFSPRLQWVAINLDPLCSTQESFVSCFAHSGSLA